MEAQAHTPNTKDIWHGLEDHLLDTASLASTFGRFLGIRDWCRVLGIGHDAGKFPDDFQEYLQAAYENRPYAKFPHAIWGAALLFQILRNSDAWIELALPILGHHTGLHKASDAELKLSQHIESHGKTEEWRNLKGYIFPLLGHQIASPKISKCPLSREMRLRMAFSCLVDADRLDTEAHFNPNSASLRSNWTRIKDLWPIFRANHLALMWEKRGEKMSRYRAKVYFDSIRSAQNPPDIFRMTVPTGGGKTRASLAFALRHAVANPTHKFRRIIVALPYTSIVDQTASEFRSIFGQPFVLEHQSQPNESGDTENDPEALRHSLAAENWDFSIIVTTTIQLFESLLSNKPSRCRKLHNIANSILILDEVQTLPPELMTPTLNVLDILKKEYGTTVVLCTATQPSIEKSHYLPAWKDRHIPEILSPSAYYELFSQLNRVRYEKAGTLTAEKLAKRITDENKSTLAIFNTRKDALQIYELLIQKKIKGLYHLSTLLCGHHRKAILGEISRKLKNDEPVVLISTQVVEAGVDLDFPIVYRAIAPLDRIVQAAGRCNREFKLGRQGGRLLLFMLEDGKIPQGAYASGLNISNQILNEESALERLYSPDIFEDYFVRLFRDLDLDERRVNEAREQLDFPEVASRYRFIEPTEQFVIVNYNLDKILPLIKNHRFKPSQSSWRALQPYVVNLMKWDAEKYKQSAAKIAPGLWQWDGAYDKTQHRGIMGDYRDPTDLIIN